MRKKNVRKEGSAMILVMCVMVVFVALSLAIVLSGSILLANSQKSFLQEQTHITAVSFSDQMDEQLQKNPGDAAQVSQLQDYIKKNIRANLLQPKLSSTWWPKEINKKTFRIVMQDGEGNEKEEAGAISVEIYWEEESEERLKAWENWNDPNPVDPARWEEYLNSQETIYRNKGIQLVITVKCEKNKVRSQIKTVYNMGIEEKKDLDEIDPKLDDGFVWRWDRDRRE